MWMAGSNKDVDAYIPCEGLSAGFTLLGMYVTCNKSALVNS